MESCPSGSKLCGGKLVRSQGWEIVFNVYLFMKMKVGQEIREKTYNTNMGPSEGLYFIAGTNIPFNINDIIKTAGKNSS
jgi:hypothetical protein